VAEIEDDELTTYGTGCVAKDDRLARSGFTDREKRHRFLERPY
jgi:hypothetical protein